MHDNNEHPPGHARPGDPSARPLGKSFYILAGLFTVIPGLFVASIPWWAPIDSTPPEPATPAWTSIVLDDHGLALAPRNAPATVVTMIDAANEFVGLPYTFGGGHRPYDEVARDDGYDSSGAASYVLHAAGLLDAPLDRAQLASFGEPGTGKWVTIVLCPGARITIAGMDFRAGSDHAGIGEPDAYWSPATELLPDCIERHVPGL